MAQDETKIKTVLGLMGRGGCRRRRSILKIKGHHEMSQEEEFSRDQARSDKMSTDPDRRFHASSLLLRRLP